MELAIFIFLLGTPMFLLFIAIDIQGIVKQLKIRNEINNKK